MMKTKEDYENLFTLWQIGNKAIKIAQEENKKMGLPNVYCKNNKMYYELPDGTITMESPFNNGKNNI